MPATTDHLILTRDCGHTVTLIPADPFAALRRLAAQIEGQVQAAYDNWGKATPSLLANTQALSQGLLDATHVDREVEQACTWSGDVDADRVHGSLYQWTCPGCGHEHQEDIDPRNEQ